MTAILKFNLDNPDDAMAHLRCVNAMKMASALWDLQQLWRKYKHLDVSEEKWDGIDMVVKDIQACFEESGLDIETLIQ